MFSCKKKGGLRRFLETLHIDSLVKDEAYLGSSLYVLLLERIETELWASHSAGRLRRPRLLEGLPAGQGRHALALHVEAPERVEGLL